MQETVFSIYSKTSYEKNNVDDAAEKIRALLSDRARCRELGQRGREEILARHTESHRAKRIMEILPTIKKKSSNMKFFSSMTNFASLAVRMEQLDTGIAARSFVAALKAADYALKANETLTEELACFVIISCTKYERLMHTGAADQLLLDLGMRNVNSEVLTLATIRILLNRGDRAGAEKLAKTLPGEDLYQTFCRSENFVSELMAASSR
jgi:hypothetical protein